MIKKIPYSEIDFDKYEACINNALQKNFYAKKEILDFLCEKWELLIYGDYDFVMPIPIKNKFGFRVVLQPLFCQQLGVFSSKLDREIEQKFLLFLNKNYTIYQYAFNSENDFEDQSSFKSNYIISKTNYQLLRKRYFKGRKSAVKSAKNLYVENLVLNDETLSFIKNYTLGLPKASDFEFFIQYLDFLQSKKYLKLFGAFLENQLLNLAIVVEDDDSHYLLGFINDPEHIRKDGSSFLIDQILQNTISAKDFSFMGSSIRGIEVFFKSFGSELKKFYVINHNRKQLIGSYFNRL